MGVIVEQLAIKARWWDAPSRSRILAEATSALIKKFSIVFFPNLHYTFITYNGRKSNEQRTKSNKQRAKSNEQRGKSNEQRAKTSEQRVKLTSNEQKVSPHILEEISLISTCWIRTPSNWMQPVMVCSKENFMEIQYFIEKIHWKGCVKWKTSNSFLSITFMWTTGGFYKNDYWYSYIDICMCRSMYVYICTEGGVISKRSRKKFMQLLWIFIAYLLRLTTDWGIP